MGQSKKYLAFDLGAESGRAIVGTFDGDRLALQEIHRFPNTPVRRGGSIYWNLPALFEHITQAISLSSDLFRGALVSLGVDTWGIDYGLLDGNGKMMGLPYQYRDPRTEGIRDAVVERLGKEFLYDQTGVQLMPINTLYQLLAEPPDRLDEACDLLFIPDLVNYLLTGVKTTERTFASTSQLYDPRKRDWAVPLLDALDLPRRILQDIGDAGDRLGPLSKRIAHDTGASAVEVVLPGTHDTASAVAAAPAGVGTWAFLSSGTWSVLGIETTRPLMDEMARSLEIGNEIGVCGTVRPLKNISGLWPIQQCRAAWMRDTQPLSYADLTRMAEESTRFVAVIDPDDPSFVQPGHMPARIAEFCERTQQAPPSNRGETVRTIMESLALRYRMVIDAIEGVAGQSIDTLHIVGGGGKNLLLNQFTANSIGRPVVVGPIEATAAGNILMQLLAMGEISSLSEGREIIRRSFDLTVYFPEDVDEWDDAYDRFRSMIQNARADARPG